MRGLLNGTHQVYHDMQFSTLQSVYNRILSLLTRMRLGKALGTTIVVATFLIAISAVPSYASATTFTQSGIFIIFDYGSAPSNLYRDVQNYPAHTLYSYWTTGNHGWEQTETQSFPDGNYQYRECFPEGNPNPLGYTDDSTCTTIYTFTITSRLISNIVCTLGSCLAPPVTSTRFILTTPLNEAVVSSTSPVTVGAHLYINSADFANDQYLSITFQNETVSALGGSALDAWNSAWGTGSTGGFPEIKLAVVSGDNDISTTTTHFVRDGRVTATYALKSPTFWSSLWFVGSLFSGNTVMSTTTTFVVGEKTDYDMAIDQGGAGLANTILFGTTTQGFSTSTIEAMTSACLPYTGHFNLFGCVQGLIVPPQSVIQNLFGQAKDGFLSYFPFGYVTRFYAIISGTGTTTLPSLSVTVPAGFPASGDTINLTMWGHLMGAGSYLSTATSTVTGHTFYATFEPYWEKFAYFVFGLGVCLRLLGMNSVVSFGFGSKEDKNKQNIKYKKK